MDLPKDTLNIAEIVEKTKVCGPGERFAIWVQGCKLGCKGCWNKEMQPIEIKQLWHVNKLYEKIISTDGIEGITISGGEPLYQSSAILKVVKKLKENGLTAMLYTGFEVEEIDDPIANELVHISDIVIYGRYLEEERTTSLKWRGSKNQKIVFNNKEYKLRFELLETEDEIEIHMDETGKIKILGHPIENVKKEVFL